MNWSETLTTMKMQQTSTRRCLHLGTKKLFLSSQEERNILVEKVPQTLDNKKLKQELRIVQKISRQNEDSCENTDKALAKLKMLYETKQNRP